ncbi:MAG TPA: AMP-binding protein [Acidimicrobiales bacterium]|nr:AMP-binding protein [Acidimicrobiales bacterium]
MPMGQALSWLAEQDPDRVAIVLDDEVITRRDLDRRANRMARAYAGFGVGRDDVVAVVLPTSLEWFVAVMAVWKLGATPMPVSSRLPDAELNPIIELADPTLVVGVAEGRLRTRRAVVPAGYEADAAIDASPLPPAVARYYRAITSGGSTGRPKVIVNHQPSVVDPDERMPGMGRDAVVLVPSPLFHTAGFSASLNGVLHGNTVIVMSRFDPGRFLDLIDTHRVTYVQAVPTMLHRVWRLPDEVRAAHDVSSLDLVFSTGGPFPAWLKKAWADWIGADKILEIYGSSEGYGSTIVTGEESLRKPGTVGLPRFGPPRILDDEGCDLGPNDVGVIYFKRPAEPNYHYLGAESRIRDGWETLGDMGYVDEDGYLFLVDRRVDMIVTGGENVFPAEVEAALEQHPAVRSSAVIGLPDDDLGQLVHAIVDVGSDDAGVSEVDESELRAHLATRLTRYKIPRTFEVVTELLRSEAGKVRRSQLRSERLAGSAVNGRAGEDDDHAKRTRAQQ